jgi:hypothetical protein
VALTIGHERRDAAARRMSDGLGGFAVLSEVEEESTWQSIPGPATTAEPWRKITVPERSTARRSAL